MKKLAKVLAGTAGILALVTTQASAQMTLWFIGAANKGGNRGHGNGHGHGHGQGHGAGHGQGGGGVPSAPEIDLSQGAAAIIIVLMAFLLIREIYLRQRQPA
jgi:hypothetical protein